MEKLNVINFDFDVLSVILRVCDVRLFVKREALRGKREINMSL